MLHARGSGVTHSRQPARPRRPPSLRCPGKSAEEGARPAELHREAGGQEAKGGAASHTKHGQGRQPAVKGGPGGSGPGALEEQGGEETRLGRRARAGEGEGRPRPPATSLQGTERHGQATGMCSPNMGRKRRKEAGTRRRSQQRRMTHDPHQRRQKPRRARCTGQTDASRREYLNNKKTKEHNSKMGRGSEQTHLQRHTNGQHACEKMLTQRRYQEIQIPSREQKAHVHTGPSSLPRDDPEETIPSPTADERHVSELRRL